MDAVIAHARAEAADTRKLAHSARLQAMQLRAASAQQLRRMRQFRGNLPPAERRPDVSMASIQTAWLQCEAAERHTRALRVRLSVAQDQLRDGDHQRALLAEQVASLAALLVDREAQLEETAAALCALNEEIQQMYDAPVDAPAA